MGNTKKKININKRQEELVEVELMMLRGIQSASKIAKQINCSIPTAQSYVNAVRARWKALNGDDLAQMRIELVERSRETENGSWETFETADNSSAKVGALKILLEVQKFQAWLVGLDITNNPHQ